MRKAHELTIYFSHQPFVFALGLREQTFERRLIDIFRQFASATGTETLTSGSVGSVAFAELVQEEILDALGLRDRGLKYVTKEGRGGRSLFAGRAPAILVEPFFGSSPKGLAATDEDREMVMLADAILRAAARAFL
jgi:N-acetylmuramoyl-L-alanine amidase